MEVTAEALVSLRELVSKWTCEHVMVSSLAEAEALVERVRIACSAAAFEQSLLQLGGRKTYQGCRIGCTCGARARFVSYRKRWVKGVCAEAQIARAYYHCSACGAGQLPWDRAQGLNERVCSPRLKALTAETCAQLSYGSGVRLLERLGVVRLEESSAEAIVEEVGVRLRASEQEMLEQCQQTEERFVAGQSRSGRLYVGMDAAKAHIGGSWHDVKVASLYAGEADVEGQDRAVRIEYAAAQEGSEQFGKRVYALARAKQLESFAEHVVIGDGAEFICNQAAIHFPAATEIVDFWHACEHIWDLSRKLYGPENAKGKRWAQDRVRSLKADGPGPLLGALKRRKPITPEAKEALRLERGYFQKNRARMN